MLPLSFIFFFPPYPSLCLPFQPSSPFSKDAFTYEAFTVFYGVFQGFINKELSRAKQSNEGRYSFMLPHSAKKVDHHCDRKCQVVGGDMNI